MRLTTLVGKPGRLAGSIVIPSASVRPYSTINRTTKHKLGDSKKVGSDVNALASEIESFLKR